MMTFKQFVDAKRNPLVLEENYFKHLKDVGKDILGPSLIGLMKGIAMSKSSRKKLKSLLDDGLSYKEIARMYGIGPREMRHILLSTKLVNRKDVMESSEWVQYEKFLELVGSDPIVNQFELTLT